MDVCVFTSDEPLYLPGYLAPVLDAHAESIDAVVVAPPSRSVRSTVRRYLRMLGPAAFARMGALFARGAILDALPGGLGRRLTGRYHSVPAVALDHGVEVRRASDVTDPSFVAWVRACNPDLILSIVCGQKLGPELLAVPERAINLHGSLLPRYRGRATAFWPLYYGDDVTGVTAHLMTETFDAGPILRRRSVPIAADDTMHDLHVKLADAGSRLAVELLAALPDADLDPRPNETTPADYHTMPTAAQRREFRRRGNAFI